MKRMLSYRLILPASFLALWLPSGGARAGNNLAGLCTACAPGAHHALARATPSTAPFEPAQPSGASLPVITAPRGQSYPRSGPERASGGSVSLAADDLVSASVVVTAASLDYFYGQGEGAFWGTRVNYPGHGFAEGEKVTVRGTMTTGEDGEMILEATTGVAQGMAPITPVAMNIRAVAGSASLTLPFGRYSHPPVEGGAGLGAPGTLLTTGGIVTAISLEGNAMTISDGSKWRAQPLKDPEGNDGLRVFLDDGPLPPVGTFVEVTGVGSNYESGGLVYPALKAVKPDWSKWKYLRTIPVHFIRVSDDDGGRPANITPSQAATWVTRANEIYAQTNVVLQYNPATDFSDFKSTWLNDMSGSNDANWSQTSSLANFVASFYYPGKMVVFVRQAGGGFSWWDLNFVAMPAYNTLHCGSLNTSLFSHEIGHYLGLWHTFPTDPFASISAAEGYFINNGGNPAVFDGDGVPDTLPDPGILPLECASTTSVTLNGVNFTLPRDNLMSYYKDADTLSPLQRQRLLWTLHWRAANKMPTPRNNPIGSGIIEAEDIGFTTHVSCPFGMQWMTPWGQSNWSNGKQLFGGCAGKGSEINFPFSVAQSGYYELAAYMTHAPDFGIVQFYVDGQSTGAIFDGYGAFVATSGRRRLGAKKIYLSAGNHVIKARIIGKNEKSWNYFMGVDCFQIN